MKTKHTPGPWEVLDWFSDSEIRWACISGDTDRQDHDMRLEFTNYVPDTEQEANARLIAAAPDLLAASIQTLDLLEELAFDGAENPECELLRNAIAKTKGE